MNYCGVAERGKLLSPIQTIQPGRAGFCPCLPLTHGDRTRQNTKRQLPRQHTSELCSRGGDAVKRKRGTAPVY